MNQNGVLADTVSYKSIPDLATLSKLFAVALQFALLVLLVDRFEIENQAFFQLSLIALGGFVVHAMLPLNWRLPFFAALSMASVAVVLGKAASLWLLGLGLFLIALCHLPIAFWKRVALIVSVAAVFAFMRAGWVATPWSDAIWPVLGSMFMFRLAIYLYDLKHGKAPVSLARAISYFFMLPNVCFPLFPVVDYTRFNKHYYDQDDHVIYQRGITWMFRGIVHLLLYRVIYHHFVLDPTDVIGLGSFVQYALATFLLYLRVSGLFHLAVGMLLLFGFNLHETHRLYYFASGFTDFWRRINIYWKDFMMKLFYYPIRFRLRGYSEFSAILIATTVVFVGTWVLHSYQWFWLRGDVLLEWHDGMFWGILAVLVVVNSLYETKHPPARSLGTSVWNWPRAAAATCRTAGTFITICLLWSLWSSDSLSQWLGMVRRTGTGGIILFVAPAILFSAARLLRPLAMRSSKKGARAPALAPQESFWRSALTTIGATGVLLATTFPAVNAKAPYAVAVVTEAALNTGLNERDKDRMVRGYYENLMAVNQHNPELQKLYDKRRQPKDWLGFHDTPGWRERPDLLDGEVMPNLTMTFKGALLHTNSLGMRDREYTEAKPENVFRIAALGASTLFGSGVRDDETFESLLESALNRNAGDTAHREFEVLNFGVPSRLGLRQLIFLQERVFKFDPDAVFYFAHQQDFGFPITNLVKAVQHGYPIPFDYVRDIVERAGVNSDMDADDIYVALRPFRHDIVRWTYQQIVLECRQRGIVPVWVYIPWTDEQGPNETTSQLYDIARSAGFVTLNILDVYRDYSQAQLRVAEWDFHANALGHQLLADALYRAVQADHESIFGQAVVEGRYAVQAAGESALGESRK